MMLIALLLSLVMFAHAHGTSPPAAPIPLPELDQRVFLLEVVSCPEANACIMNVVGEPGLLGRQVAIGIGSYQVPSALYSRCGLEKIKGKIAAAYLQETLRSAGLVILTEAHKKKGSAYLTGTLMVDGRDVTVMMFEMQLAVPRGIKVDWCEKVDRGIEV